METPDARAQQNRHQQCGTSSFANTHFKPFSDASHARIRGAMMASSLAAAAKRVNEIMFSFFTVPSVCVYTTFIPILYIRGHQIVKNARCVVGCISL